MPNQNGTGPFGQGAGTGRGRGPCGGGAKRGWMQSFGFRRRFFSQANGKDALIQEEKMLEQELKAVRQAQKDLSSKK